LLVVEIRAAEARLARREPAFCWSACAEAIFRKHGIVGVRTRSEGEDGADGPVYPVRVRGLGAPNGPAMVEGPLDPTVARLLGLGVRGERTSSAVVSDADGRPLGRLAYPEFRVRRIPVRRGERSEPVGFVSEDPRWNYGDLQISVLEAGGAWSPLAYARLEGSEERVVVAVSDGRSIVWGLPILDVLAASHAFPPLDAGYFAHERTADAFRLEGWLVDEVAAHARRCGVATVRVGRWPPGQRAAFTVREDYDRPIDDAAASELLELFARHGVRSTWCFLAARIDRPLVARLVAAGHEVALHTEAKTHLQFAAEVRRFVDETSIRPRGYTAHGGLGAGGNLGERQFRWALAQGMEYGELLGRANRLPHAALLGLGARGVVSPLALPATHRSLDAGTEPGAHHLEALQARLPEEIDRGEHVCVMNHPDVHRPELAALLRDLDLRDVWRASYAEVATWFLRSKAAARVAIDGEGWTIAFPAGLPEAAEVEVVTPEGAALGVRAEAGQVEARVERPARA